MGTWRWEGTWGAAFDGGGILGSKEPHCSTPAREHHTGKAQTVQFPILAAPSVSILIPVLLWTWLVHSYTSYTLQRVQGQKAQGANLIASSEHCDLGQPMPPCPEPLGALPSVSGDNSVYPMGHCGVNGVTSIHTQPPGSRKWLPNKPDFSSFYLLSGLGH